VLHRQKYAERAEVKRHKHAPLKLRLKKKNDSFAEPPPSPKRIKQRMLSIKHRHWFTSTIDLQCRQGADGYQEESAAMMEKPLHLSHFASSEVKILETSGQKALLSYTYQINSGRLKLQWFLCPIIQMNIHTYRLSRSSIAARGEWPDSFVIYPLLYGDNLTCISEIIFETKGFGGCKV
jgi:hypothetical protein